MYLSCLLFFCAFQIVRMGCIGSDSVRMYVQVQYIRKYLHTYGCTYVLCIMCVLGAQPGVFASLVHTVVDILVSHVMVYQSSTKLIRKGTLLGNFNLACTVSLVDPFITNPPVALSVNCILP